MTYVAEHKHELRLAIGDLVREIEDITGDVALWAYVDDGREVSFLRDRNGWLNKHAVGTVVGLLSDQHVVVFADGGLGACHVALLERVCR